MVGPKTLELLEDISAGISGIEIAVGSINTDRICSAIEAQTVAIENASSNIHRAIMTLCDVISGRAD